MPFIITKLKPVEMIPFINDLENENEMNLKENEIDNNYINRNDYIDINNKYNDKNDKNDKNDYNDYNNNKLEYNNSDNYSENNV